MRLGTEGKARLPIGQLRCCVATSLQFFRGAVVLTLVFLCAGCQTSGFGWWHALATDANETVATDQNEPPTPAETAVATEPKSSADLAAKGDTAPKVNKSAQAATATAVPDSLSDDRWVLTVRPLVPGVNEPATRWRHPALDAILSAPVARRPSLQAGLESQNAAVAANAAIILGRWRQADTTEDLARAIRNESLKLPQRQAAIETLAILKTDKAAAKLSELLSQDVKDAAGPLTPLVDIPELHAELLYARSRFVHPNDDAAFAAALASRSAVVRAEAAAAWARAKGDQRQPPDRVLELCTDSDTRVRLAALRAITVQPHPRSIEVLTRATRDFDVNVRMTAIASLGELGTPAARQVLDKMRRDPSEVARAAVVGALAAAGANDVILAAAKDESFRVRKAVAESLDDVKASTEDLGRAYQALAQQMVRDVSVEVQRSAVESLRAWPLEQAGPALLLALAEGGYTTRKLAAEQLAERWPPAKDFYVDGTAANRGEQVRKLRQQWEEEFGTVEEYALRAATRQLAASAGVSPEQTRLIEAALKQLADPELNDRLRDEAYKVLREQGPALVTALEGWTDEQLRTLPPEVYASILPQVSPIFAALARMSDPNAAVRRAALGEIRQLLAGQPLPLAALQRLRQLMDRESDALVWQAVLGLVASDPREVALRLAYMAVANASSEVRRRACENLQKVPQRGHAAVLLPMLNDPNVTVAIAAARALGAAGVEDPAPLVQLLSTPDRQLRLELAITLAKSEFEQGVAALERLAREADADIRRAAVQAMGELQNPVFVPVLIALLADRHDIQAAALASLPKCAGCSVQQDDELNLLPDEKCRRWKQWYEQQHANKAGKLR